MKGRAARMQREKRAVRHRLGCWWEAAGAVRGMERIKLRGPFLFSFRCSIIVPVAFSKTNGRLSRRGWARKSIGTRKRFYGGSGETGIFSYWVHGAASKST